MWPYSRAVFSIHHGKYQALDVGAYSELLAGRFCIDGQHLGLSQHTGDDDDDDDGVDDADVDFDFVDYDEEDEEEEGENKYDNTEEDVLLIIIIHHFTSFFLIASSSIKELSLTLNHSVIAGLGGSIFLWGSLLSWPVDEFFLVDQRL